MLRDSAAPLLTSSIDASHFLRVKVNVSLIVCKALKFCPQHMHTYAYTHTCTFPYMHTHTCMYSHVHTGILAYLHTCYFFALFSAVFTTYRAHWPSCFSSDSSSMSTSRPLYMCLPTAPSYQVFFSMSFSLTQEYTWNSPYTHSWPLPRISFF